MLEKPNIKKEKIVAYLESEYGIHNAYIKFLPFGADINTAVYKVLSTNGDCYFFKLKGGSFDETGVSIPRFFRDYGIKEIIAPIETKKKRLWGILDSFKTILYPYIEGLNGYEKRISSHQLKNLGSVLKNIHESSLPKKLHVLLREESYSSKWRKTVNVHMKNIQTKKYDEPITIQLVEFLQNKRSIILDLVNRAERLAKELQEKSRSLTVCHSDLHAGNILICKDETFFIVDWDELLLAPKERDLMFIGGGLLHSDLSPQEEEKHFYETYGKINPDPVALAYYRYERIVQDIAEYCNLLLLSNRGGEDRKQSLVYLKRNFLPGSTIEIAYQADKTC